MRPLDRVTVASRVFCLAAVTGLLFVTREAEAILSILLVSTIALVAVYMSLTTLLSPTVIVTVEGALIGLVIGLALPAGAILLPYLVVLALIAGTTRGVVGVTAVMLAQLSTIGVLTATVSGVPDPLLMYQALAPWFVTGIIAGLIGSWLRETGRTPPSVAVDGYESARRILSQLRSVTKNLSSGLDIVTIAGQVIDTVVDRLQVSHAGVFVRTERGLLSPLAFSESASRSPLTTAETEIAEVCWKQMKAVVQARPGANAMFLALPLSVGSRMVAVVLAESVTGPADSEVAALVGELAENSLKLETALTFDEIRSLATAEERQRLSREIHDGIAQEVASLGYLIDDLRSETQSPRQRELVTLARQELSRIVGELRLSIFDLRSEVANTTGLGAALSDYLRQVGSRSKLTVHLTLDEAPTRLRVETEAELLRIAGEAITNARKHSGAENLWVTCTVHPPYARLEVRDDGRGMSRGRTDSYGLHVMRERVARINGDIELLEPPGCSGTTVRVTVGRPVQHLHTDEEKRRHVSDITNHGLVGG